MKAFLEVYANLRADNLETLKSVYRDDIRFVDPAHDINGLDNLTLYLENLYENVRSINFSFTDQIVGDRKGYVRWDMDFSHESFAKGRTIHVEGMTYIEFDESGRVFYHRDYFDLGAMLYEHLPLLGRLITSLKRRLGT